MILPLTLAGALGVALAAVALDGLDRRERAALAAALGIPLGIGATSLLFVAWRAIGGDAFWPLVLPEIALLAAAVVLLWRRRARAPSGTARDGGAVTATVIVCLGVAILVAVATVSLSRIAPSGQWDAWAIWNVKGRMLAWARDWRSAFDIEIPHTTYPLLLPAAVGRLLGLAPDGAAAAPAAVAAVVAAACVLVPAAALLALRGPAAAVLAALLVAGGPLFVEIASWLYADVPVGLFLVAGSGALALSVERSHRGAAALGGLLLGMAAWTKNEGLAMLAAGGVALALSAGRRGGRAGVVRLGAPFLAGALAMLVPLLAVRAAAPAGDEIVLDAAGSGLARLLEPERWTTIARALLAWLDPRSHPAPVLLAAVTALAWGRLRSGLRFVLGAVALCLLADVLAYVVSPLPLAWQLGTSLDRVLLQLWPATVLGALLLSGPAPADQRAAGVEPEAEPDAASRSARQAAAG